MSIAVNPELLETIFQEYAAVWKVPLTKGSIHFAAIDRWVDADHPLTDEEFKIVYGMTTREYFEVFHPEAKAVRTGVAIELGLTDADCGSLLETV